MTDRYMATMENKKKRLQLDKQCHWQPFELHGEKYDLSHLDAHIFDYIQPSNGQLSEKVYTFHITYSFHCFAKDYDHLTDLDRKNLMYATPKESRPFCFKRYELSKKLPDIIKGLGTSYIFHGGYESYATCQIEENTEYFISFVTYREKKKLRLHVKSAYPLEERKRGRRKKVGFFNIARKLKENKPLPKP